MTVVVAPATPWGSSALAVVRLSGSGVRALVEGVVCVRGEWAHGRSRRVDLRDGNGVFDDGLAVWHAAPASYTGEDTLEVSCHGSPLIVDRLLEALRARGARLAEPGAFTRRAVENGKLDLLGAEAVDQVCRATTDEGLRIARDAASGRLGTRLASWRSELLELAADLEARLDLPGDELALLSDATVRGRLDQLAGECAALAATAGAGRVLVEGARVALVGAVNAGKSSLFNRLVGHERAIVHELPGTTRDVVEARVRIGPLAVTLLDTAGERLTDDPVEAAGLALGRRLIDGADLLIVVLRARVGGVDATEQQILRASAGRPHLVVYNGVDRPGVGPAPEGALATSALRGDGLDALESGILRVLIGSTPAAARLVIASRRQAALLEEMTRKAQEASASLAPAGPAVAVAAVTDALAAMDALTGADTREEILSAVFRRFCIGK